MQSEADEFPEVDLKEIDTTKDGKAIAAGTFLNAIRECFRRGSTWEQMIHRPPSPRTVQAFQHLFLDVKSCITWSQKVYPFLCTIAYGLCPQHDGLLWEHIISDTTELIPEHVFNDLMYVINTSGLRLQHQ